MSEPHCGRWSASSEGSLYVGDEYAGNGRGHRRDFAQQIADTMNAYPAALARAKELEDACIKMNHEICQTLGRALRYPRYGDDLKNFPTSDSDEVCVGEHVAESIAMEAANTIDVLRQRVAELTTLVEHQNDIMRIDGDAKDALRKRVTELEAGFRWIAEDAEQQDTHEGVAWICCRYKLYAQAQLSSNTEKF